MLVSGVLVVTTLINVSSLFFFCSLLLSSLSSSSSSFGLSSFELVGVVLFLFLSLLL